MLFSVWLCISAITLWSQIQRTSVPIGDAAAKALDVGSLTGRGAKPFHVHIVVSEPENPQSPYKGTIEEWWASPGQWRRVVTSKDGLRQTIVVAQGKRTERDEGDYFPLWLRSFVTAAFDPIPDVAPWSATGIMVDPITAIDAKSDACARAKFKIGTGDQATDAFTSVCFDGEGRLSSYVSPRYSMEFHDYSRFGQKQIARKLVDDPEPGTTLVGQVDVLEEIGDSPSEVFVPLAGNDNRFASVAVSSAQMDTISAGNPPINWPSVRSGNTQGHLAIYVSVDGDGHVREAWPLNSDNAGLEDPARDQVRKWTMKPAVDGSGNRVQVDGGLGFAFLTKTADPLPQLTNQEVRRLATKMVEPIWPAGSVHRGDVIEAEISVNEQGKLAGIRLGATRTTPAALVALIKALHQWEFQPLIRDGKPQYFQGTVQFAVQ